MRRWSMGLVTCAVAVPLLLAGCAEKHQASQSLPTTSTTTASKTLPPLGPADFPVPVEARQKTSQGVVAFTKYYFDLSNHLLTTLDSAPLRNLSRNCETCTALADGYEQSKAAGYQYEGGEVSLSGNGTVVLRHDTAEMSIVLEQAAVTVRDSAGAVLADRTSGAYSLTGGIALAWDNERSTWVVTQLDADRV